jgi:hypothetical protein
MSDAVDATRISDGKLVWIKHIFTGREEMQMLQRLCLPSSPLAQDPKNSAAPILQMFVDPEDSNYSFVVMPFLRPVADPPFKYIGEVCDFIDQTLEVCSVRHSAITIVKIFPGPGVPPRTRHCPRVSAPFLITYAEPF